MVLTFLIALATPSVYAQANEDCYACHSDKELTQEKNGKVVPLYVDENKIGKSIHGKQKCIGCHQGFNPDEMPHKPKIEPVNCMVCHKDAAVKHAFHPQMIKAKGNNTTADLNCKGCHGTHEVISVKSAASPFYGGKLFEACGKCHSAQKEKYVLSAHAKAYQKNIKGAPDCKSCHKSAISLKKATNNADSLTVKKAQEKLCLGCHLDNPEVRDRVEGSGKFIKEYDKSVHGKALHGGNAKAATCVDCHDSHSVNGPNDPNSPVYKTNIPNTCAKCHSEIAKTYATSIHAQAVAKGNMDAPVCTDCHGEHNILKHNDPNSPVASKNVSAQVCTPCHASVKLSSKYGFAPNRVETFNSSYHGLALKGGVAQVANCASCHGFHDIKPSTDSTSRVNKKNLVKTCGKCHPGANENFTVGKIHVTEEAKDSPILYWIATIYLILIGSTIGGMFFHNFIDFVKKAKIKKMRQRGLLPYDHPGHALYLRMSLSERIQHFALLSSFFTLVITGFMLRFPDAWWVQSIKNFSPAAFDLRGVVHRVAAVIMVGASLFHIYYLAFTQRGRELFMDLLPRPKDAKDALGILKYNLGISKDKPLLDRFSYIEKAEYWALIWGTIVMTVTGVIMWFDNTFIGMFTKLGWDIARTVHYYEAWLAFLSIVVWHFYFVLFNPDIYPMSLAWIKGTITEEEMHEEHPLELERIKAQREKENKQNENTPEENSGEKSE